MKAVIKRTVNEEKSRAKKRSKELKKSYLELRPSYLKDPVWEGLVARWNHEDHIKRSEAGVKNRKKVQNLHSSGAKSFQEVEKVTID